MSLVIIEYIYACKPLLIICRVVHSALSRM